MTAHAIARLRGRRRDREEHLPGEAGIWVFILGDLLAFAMFFGIYVYERSEHPLLFRDSQETLHVAFGAANTVLLLTGSLFVVFGMDAIRGGAPLRGRRWFVASAVCGAGFAVNKVIEYASKFHAGHGPYDNDFFMFFFGLTGIHFLHLIVGMFVLLHMWRVAGREKLGEGDLVMLESGASYWHLVDLLWIVLFALLYLMS